MRARDEVAAGAVRSTLAAIDNAGAVEAPPSSHPALGVGARESARRELTDDQTAGIVRGEIDERRAAAAEYDARGKPDRARRLRAEADVLEALLLEA